MKQFIVLMGMIALGTFLYSLIAGGDGSLLSLMEAFFRHQIEGQRG